MYESIVPYEVRKEIRTITYLQRHSLHIEPLRPFEVLELIRIEGGVRHH